MGCAGAPGALGPPCVCAWACAPPPDQLLYTSLDWLRTQSLEQNPFMDMSVMIVLQPARLHTLPPPPPSSAEVALSALDALCAVGG